MTRQNCLKACVAAVLGALGATSFAGITLSDGGSSVDLDDNGVAYNWFLFGTDHLYQEEYFFRRDPGGTFVSLTGLGAPVISQPLGRMGIYTYTGGGVEVEVTYLLTGAGNTADLAESVRVRNLTGDNLYFELLEYDDFDLNDTIGDDNAFINNPNSIGQLDGGISLSAEVVTAPPATFQEVRDFNSLLLDITGTPGYNLNGANNNYTGDATFAFQWVFNLGPNQSFIMSKDKLLAVPEPGSLLAFGGLVALAIRRRKK